jgi:hypothetical protein
MNKKAPVERSFKLLMLGAMYENGGNTTHRLLDGHPELFVYPFESQIGTKYVNDFLSSMFPLKYRWPIFPNSAGAVELYRAIIDEEGKVRARTPYVSKFRTAEIEMNDDERMRLFIQYLGKKPLTRAHIVAAFFTATFQAWKNVQRTGREKCCVGYSPIIGVDGDKIIEDLDGNGFVLHIIRNPFSAYADTSKRAVPLNLAHYMTGWTLNQYYAKIYAERYPNHFFVRRFEDIVQAPLKALGGVLKKVGVDPFSPTLTVPSWNGAPLEEVYPWGTIRTPTGKANRATARELTRGQIDEIYARTAQYLEIWDYRDFYRSLVS